MIKETPMVSVILAAGKGTRMNLPNRHKVTCNVAGEPVICRAIRIFRKNGIKNHIVVVGQLAEQVMQVASAVDPAITYSYQAEQLGTGNAAKHAARVLQKYDFDGYVLITAGDKVFSSQFLGQFVKDFLDNPCDLLLVTGRSKEFPTSGIVQYSAAKKVTAVVEVFDIARAQLLMRILKRLQMSSVGSGYIKKLVLGKMNTDKAAKAFGDFWELLNHQPEVTLVDFQNAFPKFNEHFHFPGTTIPVSKMKTGGRANLSFYLFRSEPLFAALEKLESSNAQNEEYLTDCVKIIAAEGGDIREFRINKPTDLMAFNTPEELENIRREYSSANE